FRHRAVAYSQSPQTERPPLPGRLAAGGAAGQGVAAAATRSVAAVADADANSLSAATGADAVDQLWRPCRGLYRGGAGAGDGIGTIGRRLGMARHFRRGCA